MRIGLALLILLVAAPARGAPAEGAPARGTVALVNLQLGRGYELVQRAAEVLVPYLGGWARERSIAALLGGRPNPGALPAGEVGQELAHLVERVRARRPSTSELHRLGRLLGVDYLLLLREKATGYTAWLFSVGRHSFAPHSLEGQGREVAPLRGYLLAQTAPPEKPAPRRSWKTWVIWGAAAALGGLTLGLALSARNESSGDLRIRVTR